VCVGDLCVLLCACVCMCVCVCGRLVCVCVCVWETRVKLAEHCTEVVGVDIDKLRIEKAQCVKECLNVSNVEYRTFDLFSDEFERLQPFDLCLCLGFLHRIPDPYTALARLGQLSAILIIEWKVLKHGPHWRSFAKFTPGEYREDDYYGTQFWLLSFQCLEEILRRLGFRYFHRIDDPSQTRAIMIAGKIPNDVFDQPDEIGHRGRIRTFLSHTKAYLKSVSKIMSGEINS